MTTRGRLFCVSFIGAALLAACGSTVPTSRTNANGEMVLLPGNSSDAIPSQDGAVGAAASSGTNTSDSGSVKSKPASAASVHFGPGVDATTISIGLTIQDNNATVSSIASAYNVQLADNRGAYEALVRYFNAHGGIAGRKLRPIYYTYDPTSGNVDQIGQAACATFTEDANVFAALDTIWGDSFNTCMQRRGRVMLPYGLYFGSETTWERYPNVVAADGLPFNDAGKILAEHLARSGFLSKSTRLGAIVRSSDELTEAYRRGFVPTLAKFGLNVAQTHFIRDAQAASEISGYTADISSAVLKFQSSGIDRVVFFDTGSYAALVFSQTAEQQQYRPRYGFTSLNSIVALQGDGSAAPQAQMVGAQGVSWETNADGLTKARTRSAQQCDAILKDAGIGATDVSTEASYLKTCQTFFLFKAAADIAGRNLNRDTFIGSAERLGSTFVSTNTWNGMTRFGVNEHSGVSVFRPFIYREDCSCFVVSGGIQPVGSA